MPYFAELAISFVNFPCFHLGDNFDLVGCVLSVLGICDLEVKCRINPIFGLDLRQLVVDQRFCNSRCELS